MKHIHQITVEMLKELLSAESYYSLFLNGSFGKHTGQDWYAWNGLCPFHTDKNPGSFYLNKKTGSFKCFSCGAKGGDIIDFHMQVNGLAFKPAFKALKEVANA